MKHIAAAGIAIAATILAAGPAWADSGSIDSVEDAGGGSVTLTYTVTSTSQSDYGYQGWYAYVAEDHGSRTCNPQWANYLRHVEEFHEASGTATRTVPFRPFFPRQAKFCIYLNNAQGKRAVGERTVDVPTGYGMQRSSGYNCSSFHGQAGAQDYYWLYPGDPSNLDWDNDGAACEENGEPWPGPQIPPEPTPEPTPTPTPSPSPSPAPPGDQSSESPSRPTYKLKIGVANSFHRKALRRAFRGSFRHGYAKDLRCWKAARLIAKCRSEWVVGDVSFKGRARVRDYSARSAIRVALRVRRTNWYCRDTGGRRCSKIIRRTYRIR